MQRESAALRVGFSLCGDNMYSISFVTMTWKTRNLKLVMCHLLTCLRLVFHCEIKVMLFVPVSVPKKKNRDARYDI